MLLGYHLLWSWTANVVGSEEQKNKAQENIIKNNYFIGGDSKVRYVSQQMLIVVSQVL